MSAAAQLHRVAHQVAQVPLVEPPGHNPEPDEVAGQEDRRSDQIEDDGPYRRHVHKPSRHVGWILHDPGPGALDARRGVRRLLRPPPGGHACQARLE